MTEVAAIDIQGLLLKERLSASEVVGVRRLVFASKDAVRALRELAAKLEAGSSGAGEKTALAICYWVQGKYQKVLDVGTADRSDQAALFVTARSLIALGRQQEARDLLKPGSSRSGSGELQAVYAEAARKCGDRAAAASAANDGIAKFDACAALYAEAGIAADMAGEFAMAREFYEKAVECECEHVEALFRLAYISDLYGDEDTAVELYRRCAAIKPVRSRALVNLGLLYEELGRDADAADCFRLVAECHPANTRVKLCLKDAEAGRDMFFDEEQQKRRERRNKILETPISDFELSVRSRNCLEKMNVRTVGDLCRIGEIQLLSFKNFGETSLNEIKQIMASKGLRLGQSLEGEEGKPAAKIKVLKKKPVDQTKLLAKPVDDLGLSVRSQHCMQLLGVKTIGDLVAKSEKELLGARNFGQTSLTEIRKKLAGFGLSLAQ